MRTIITLLPSRIGYLRGKATVEIGYPWLSYGAIIALEQIVTPEFDILEFGAGGSTIFFSRRCRSVKSFESDKEWYDKVKKALPEESNVELNYSNIHQTLAAIKEEPLEYYDIILVDSGPHYRHRRAILDLVPPLLKVGGHLVLDNYCQKHLISFPTKGFEVYTFDDLYIKIGTRIYKKKEKDNE